MNFVLTFSVVECAIFYVCKIGACHFKKTTNTHLYSQNEIEIEIELELELELEVEIEIVLHTYIQSYKYLPN